MRTSTYNVGKIVGFLKHADVFGKAAFGQIQGLEELFVQYFVGRHGCEGTGTTDPDRGRKNKWETIKTP